MSKALSIATTRAITKQLVELSTTKPCEGIAVEFSEENIREVFADIDGPTGTPFEGGIFRVKLLLGDDFPDAPPKGYFLTKVFHPNISEAGDICVNVLKKDWKPDLGIRHVLLVGVCSSFPFPAGLGLELSHLLLQNVELMWCRGACTESRHGGYCCEAHCLVRVSISQLAQACPEHNRLHMRPNNDCKYSEMPAHRAFRGIRLE